MRGDDDDERTGLVDGKPTQHDDHKLLGDALYTSLDSNGRPPPFGETLGWVLWMLVQIYGLALAAGLILFGSVLALQQYMIDADMRAWAHAVEEHESMAMGTWPHWRAVLWLALISPAAMSIPYVSVWRVFGSEHTRDIGAYNFGFFFGLMPVMELLLRGFYGNGKVFVEALTCVFVFSSCLANSFFIGHFHVVKLKASERGGAEWGIYGLAVAGPIVLVFVFFYTFAWLTGPYFEQHKASLVIEELLCICVTIIYMVASLLVVKFSLPSLGHEVPTGNLWGFGYPTFAAVTMITRLMISGLSSFKAIAISSCVLVAVDGVLRLIGPTKQLMFNNMGDTETVRTRTEGAAALAVKQAEERVQRSTTANAASALPKDFKQSEESIAVGETAEQEQKRLAAERAAAEAEAEAAIEAEYSASGRGPRDRSQTHFVERAIAANPIRAAHEQVKAEEHARHQKHFEETKREHTRGQALTDAERHASAIRVQNKIMIDRILSEMLAHVCAISYGCICSFIVRVMVYGHKIPDAAVFVVWSLVIQCGTRFALDLICCIVETYHDGLAHANVWSKRKWTFVFFAFYMLFAAGLWLYVITFNVLTPTGSTPMKYGIGWE